MLSPSALNKSIRAMNENRKWMDAVKARDGKCLKCGSVHNLESHHWPPFAELLNRLQIKSRADAKAKAVQLWNIECGVTLCAECHYVEHGRSGKPPEFPRIVKPLSCAYCGKAFVVRPSLQRENWGKCCSRRCVDSLRSIRQAGDKNPNWKGGLRQVQCLCCKTSFEVKLAQIKRGGGRFCGRSCLRRYYNENR